MDRLVLYDTLYALASGDGREEALFGSCAPLAREAFERSLIGDGFPIIWYELPLLGNPRFDLHVALSRETLHAGARFLPHAGNGYDELFRWYAEEEAGGNGLAFAYDVSTGNIDSPAVHVNVNGSPLEDVDRFFDLAAGLGAADLFRSFTGTLPPGWRVWYTGVHPGRPGAPIRVDCLVDSGSKDAYRSDHALFEQDLLACGFTASGPQTDSLLSPILESPFGLELQFDIMRNGTLGPTLGISAAFPYGPASRIRTLFEEKNPIAELMGKAEALGLADGRWISAAGAAFSTLVPLPQEPLVLYCNPTFLKLRMREGAPLDAKLYLQASAVARSS